GGHRSPDLGVVQRRGRRQCDRRPRSRARHLPDRGHHHRPGVREARPRRDRRALPTPGQSPVDSGQHSHRRPVAHRVGAQRPMSMPFYVAPEQVMKDRADYARKGIARGRALIGIRYTDGVLIVAENPSNTLRKVSEIYDRIAFAGVGRYSEFEQLRIAGVRHADLKGYSFSREDVDARSLANAYAQILNQVFTHEIKP